MPPLCPIFTCVDQDPDPYWEYGSRSTTLRLVDLERIAFY